MHHIKYINPSGAPEHIEYPASEIIKVLSFTTNLRITGIQFEHYFID
jgi:hypothetical protein